MIELLVLKNKIGPSETVLDPLYQILPAKTPTPIWKQAGLEVAA